MIVGQLRSCKESVIGFDADDYLIVKNEYGTYKWSTIAYDKMESGNAKDIIVLSVLDEDYKIAAVAFTRDGKLAALGSGGKLVQMWNVEQGKCIGTIYFSQRVSRVKLPADGHTLECQFSNGTYCRIDLKTGEKGEMKRPNTKPFVSNLLLKRIKSMKVKDIQSTSKGNAIVLTEK